uniref:Uncharacterized protein n=1 Tax=Caudovirales sp. ctrNG92 TaxID=2827638 RepID=A0A8S5SEZ5_9CAUD|nr:MAG TPA: hypothetical protein [Caudovirales sp. ctrNG92]
MSCRPQQNIEGHVGSFPIWPFVKELRHDLSPHSVYHLVALNKMFPHP